MKNKITLLFAGAMSLFATHAMAQRTCIIEEFSSSTCPPCASMNAWLDPLFTTNNANVEGSGLAVIKYQMNFPNPGTDVSYNQMGKDRSSYYIAGMPSWGIPTHMTNGKWHDTASNGGTSASLVQTEITNCKTGTPTVKVSATYKVKSLSATEDSVFVTVVVTPTTTMAGTYYLITGLTERYYQNTSAATGHTTSQTDFYHVMRKMYPSSTGTVVTGLTANVPQTFTFADKITIAAAPVQMSNTWWANPYDGHVVAFLEDHTPALRAATRILNGYAAAAKWTTDINNVNNFQNIKVMPNPATSQAAVLFNVNKPTSVSLTVVDMVGRVVFQQAPQTVDMNAQRIIIPTNEFANGTYNVILRSDDGSTLSQRLVVSK